MKKIIFLIALFYSVTFAQDWNSTVTTTISESTVEKMDQFTNKDGNHLLIKKSNGNIVYYNINSLGTVDGNKTATLESNGDFPNIVGTNDIVYAFYKVGSYIKLKYSTNGGTSWTYDSNLDLNIGSNECNGIDAIYETNRGVHLVWASLDSDPYFETYYYNLKINLVWDYYKNVTDYSGFQDGSTPTVTYSSESVHVSFHLSGGFGGVATRDRLNGSWQTPQNALGNDESSVERLIASGSYLYMIYSQWVSPSYFDLAYKSRTLSGTWSGGSGTDIETNIFGTEYTFDICKTYNNNLQLVYELDDGQYWDLLHRSYDGNWSSTFPVDNNQSFAGDPKRISNTSNDFFVVWKRNNSNSLFYRQYDDYPLAPQNLAVQIHTEGGETYPKLTWSFNNEPDVFIKINAYQVWRRYSLSGGDWSAWYIIGYSDGDENQYIDYTISGLYAEANTAEYKLKVRDYTNHFSDYSSSVSVNFSDFNKISSGYVLNEYGLEQNYPNPFNPTTRISYSIKQQDL